MDPAWEEVLVGFKLSVVDPGFKRLPGLLRDFKLYRTVRFLLHNNRP